MCVLLSLKGFPMIFLMLINIHFITFKITKLRYVIIEMLTINNVLFIHTKYILK